LSRVGTALGKKHFEAFRAECEYWLNALGLKDYRVYYEFAEVPNGLAGCQRDVEGRVCTITLNPFQENCSKAQVDVRRSAKHEVIHLLLAELAHLNGKRLVTEGQWDAAEHAVVRRLEKALQHG
jgi:hypothetical protein